MLYMLLLFLFSLLFPSHHILKCKSHHVILQHKILQSMATAENMVNFKPFSAVYKVYRAWLTSLASSTLTTPKPLWALSCLNIGLSLPLLGFSLWFSLSGIFFLLPIVLGSLPSLRFQLRCYISGKLYLTSKIWVRCSTSQLLEHVQAFGYSTYYPL